ncbi:voltage-gated potassium channel [Pseudobutyrivibrio sp. ACV-2]|uniref:ion transporter n=1 Tax=Pseudobutyrivibrio sp. ACV-2 TaxID=1520801 RepID=UPI0008957E7B|nr:ion transporter [Pseudobutyrivibrio sp. ACV-2]SEA09562.1 voltage-gated potassium channel [Pseudobutyrivibrio sp. ACV-2]
MYDFKKRVYEVIEVSHVGDNSSRAYDVLMTTAIIVGLVPLTMKGNSIYTVIIDVFTSVLFLIDYIARVYTADYKMGYKHYRAYIAYIFTPLAIFDFLSIVPVIYVFLPVSSLIGLLRLFRVFRVLKLVRYSKTMVIIANVVRKVKKQLMAVLILITVYIFVSAMLVFQLEPDLFNNFFDALYWATISITTIGYGDISPVTPVGRLITMISALVGMAVIALPTGIITAAYMAEITKKKSKYEL